MNLFIVPSWYPSDTNPLYGIFVKEQIVMMSQLRPDWKIGVSTWGQGDSEKLIWVKDHLKNMRKFNKHGLDNAAMNQQNGISEYYQPALGWTKRFRKGNLREIIRCNELNYQAYVLEHGKPDYLMVQACYPGVFIADFLSQKYGVPVHLHIRLGGAMFESLLSDLGSMKNELLEIVSRVRRLSTTSDFHRKSIEKWVPDCKVIYNPINLDFFECANQPSNYALAVGRLEAEKGFNLLLDAMALVPNLKLKIAGSGSEKNVLQKQVEKNKLDDRVELLGEQNREEVKNLMQHCQFLIVPSRYETFGNVAVEAMACGKPVVATKCGGPEEVVQPETGYLAEIDVKDLASKIQLMSIDYESFEPGQIRKIAEDRFSPKSWISHLEELLK